MTHETSSPDATSNHFAPHYARIENPSPAVALVTLNHASSRNALSQAALADLTRIFIALGESQDIRAIVLAAEGPAFCSGHDLKEITAAREKSDHGRAFFEDVFYACARLMMVLNHSPKPIIAAVEGVATAAGCQLVASCDLAIAGEKAQFRTPGVDIGLFCSTPMVALSRVMASKHALEMLLLGDAINAEDALRFGLVNRVAPAGQAKAAALAWAQTLATKSPAALAAGKRAFWPQTSMTMENAYAYASAVMTENLLHAEAIEGISAFFDKRAPQ